MIVAFVNPLSGAQKGSELLPLLQKELGEAHVFDIVKEKGPYGPLDKYAIIGFLFLRNCFRDLF